jgi:hypothetical protein
MYVFIYVCVYIHTWRGAEWFVLFAKYNYDYQVEEDEVGGEFSLNGGEKGRV